MADKVDNQTMKVTADLTQVVSSVNTATRSTNQWEAALAKALKRLDQLAKANPGVTARLDVRGDPNSTDELARALPVGFRYRASRRVPTPGEALTEAIKTTEKAEAAQAKADQAKAKAEKAQAAADAKARDKATQAIAKENRAESKSYEDARAKAEQDAVRARKSTRQSKHVLSGLDETILKAQGRGRDTTGLEVLRGRLSGSIARSVLDGGSGLAVEDMKDASFEAKKAAQKEERALLDEDRKIAEDRAEIARNQKKVTDAEERDKKKLIKQLERQHGVGGRGDGVLPAAGRYGTLRAIDTGIREGTASLVGMITGGGGNLGAGMLGLVGAAGNTLHRYGMTRYAVGPSYGGGSGGGAAGGGAAGGGGGGGFGVGMAARGLLGTAGGAMAVGGSVIAAVAAGAIALHNKGAEQRTTATDHAFAFNRAVGRGFGVGFNRGGIRGVAVDGMSQQTSNELEAFYSMRQNMYTTLADKGMARGEVDAKLGELTSAFGTRFSKFYKGRTSAEIGRALTGTLAIGHDYGLSAGTQGAYMQEGLSRLSGRGGHDMKEVLAAQRWGINEDQFLQQSMSLRAGAASAGFALDRTQMGDFSLQMQRAGVDKTQAFNVQNALMGSSMAASSAMTGGYGALGQSAMMAYSVHKAGSYEDAIEYNRNMSNQERITALKSVLGETGARRYLMDAGLSKQTASNILTGQSTAGWKPEDLEKVTGAMTGLESFRAKRDAAQQPYESSQEREERMMRIDKTFDSIAASMASFTDNLTKIAAKLL